MKPATDEVCLDSALRLLSRRDHSCWELARKLELRGFSADAVACAVAACKRLNYLDDARFCDAYTAELRRKGNGVMRIVQKLKSKGVPAPCIQTSIASQCHETEQVKDCRRALEKKIGKRPGRSAEAPDELRLRRFLFNRGFSADVIRQVLQEGAADADGD